jgi:hypothetical protein
MASAGTLLSDLDGRTPAAGADEDLVQKIMADMNLSGQNQIMGGGVGGAAAMPPAPSGRAGPIMNVPNPNTTYSQAVDPATATAHLIGKSYPTPADFAQLMTSGYAPAMQSLPTQQVANSQSPQLTNLMGKGNWYTDIVKHLRTPVLVALIVFIVSLPVVNVMIGHYVPNLLRAGGDLTTLGLLAKSAFAGGLFWTIQNILVPLVAAP